MATFAVLAVLSFVHIVLKVTGVALATAEVTKVLGAMALLTAKATVSAIQRESCHRQVVKREIRPVGSAMTLRALSAVASLMDVITPMTGNTSLANI